MSPLHQSVVQTRAGSHFAIHESEGTGPVLLAVGGLSVRPLADSGLYRAFEDAAANGTRCVMMEIAGGGEWRLRPGMTMDTWLSDIAQMFEERVQEPAIWTGSSVGAWLMVILHQRHPEWFRAMCAVAPAFDWDQQYIGPALRDGKLVVIDGVVANPDGTAVAHRDLLVSMAQHHVLRAPCRLTAPLHVIFGARDEIAPQAAVRRFIETAHGAPCTGQLVLEADHSIAKLDWAFALERYREWLGRQVAATKPGRVPEVPGNAR